MDIRMDFEEALQQLETGVYGEDVREAIYTACYLAHEEAGGIGDKAIKTNMLDDGAVTNAKIAEGTIDGLHKIKENSITSSRLADDSIYTRHIHNGSITAEKLDSNAVTGDKIALNSIDGSCIKEGTIYGSRIHAEAIDTEHIKTGAVTGGKIAGLAIEGNHIVDNAISSRHISDEAITTDKVTDGAITTEKIRTSAVTADKISAGSVTTTKIADSAIETAKLANESVTTAKISDGAVTSDKIGGGAVTTNKILMQAITSDKISPGAVGNTEIADKAVTFAKLSQDLQNSMLEIKDITALDYQIILSTVNSLWEITDDSQITINWLNDESNMPYAAGFVIKPLAVTTNNIADGAITAEKIAEGAISALAIPDGSIKTAKLADGAITTAKIADKAVATGKIADSAVTQIKIATGAVGAGKIADGAIITDKIADNAITTDKIQPLAVAEGNIAMQAVTTQRIANKAITYDKLAAGAVAAGVIVDGAITTAKIADRAVTEGKIGSLAITTDKIAMSAITTNRIADGAVTDNKIKANAVAGAHITDAAIVNRHLSDNCVSSEKIQSQAITADKIADGAITTAKIADEAVETGKIAPLSITEDKLATALQEKLFLGTSWVAVSRNKINPSAIVIENPDEEIPIEQQQEAAADALASAYPWRTSGGSAKFATRMDSDDGRGSLPLNPTTYAVWQTGKRIHGELQFTSEYDFTEGYKQGTIKCNEWVEEQKALAEEIERIKAQEYGYDVHTGCTVTVLSDGTDEHYADFSVDISAFTVHEYYLENGKSLALKAPTAGILAKNGDETSTSIANEYSANDLTWAIAYSFPDEAQADNYIIPLTRAQYEAAVAENDNIIDKAAKIAELEALVDPAYSNALSRLLKKTQIIAAIMTEMYGAAAMGNITETIMCQDGFNRKIVLLPKWRPSHLPLRDTCYTTIGGNITKFDGTHIPITGYINSNGTVAFYVDRVETKTEVDSTVFFNKLNLWFDYELA